MPKLILATNNSHKISEICAILSCSGIEILSARDFPDFPQVEETGKTLAENALLKTRAAWNRYHLPSVADDTGLEVDYLGGAPGVYSARFAGPGGSFADNNRKLLDLLRGVPEHLRTARFRTVIAFVDQVGGEHLVEGVLRGRIAATPIGEYGFGYDPIFLVEETRRTLAQFPSHEKNTISHRSRALTKIRAVILRDLTGLDSINEP
ncbi:MAG: non-canonical purine NTP pyrophosphatase, RdgB/HAM1 family [candidate division Zixibacteria bacterium RBG_16_53_22]|nr:MAG: non-canonical purine NTP pyrophosphatase, RdgB/HAM1 family [candidate division Zixibacteria bacterium RBG_16_53_22]